MISFLPGNSRYELAEETHTISGNRSLLSVSGRYSNRKHQLMTQFTVMEITNISLAVVFQTSGIFLILLFY